MIISKGHVQFASLTRLLQVCDVSGSITFINDPHPDLGGPMVHALHCAETDRSVEVWYTADKCELLWLREIGEPRIIPLDDIPNVVGRVIPYLEGMTSRDLTDISIESQ